MKISSVLLPKALQTYKVRGAVRNQLASWKPSSTFFYLNQKGDTLLSVLSEGSGHVPSVATPQKQNGPPKKLSVDV